jgi:hypothetical protein
VEEEEKEEEEEIDDGGLFRLKLIHTQPQVLFIYSEVFSYVV